MSKWKIAGIAIALFAVAVSLLNASWLAPAPAGKLVLVAQRGIAQNFDRAGLTDETCTAARLRPVAHNFIDNSLFGMKHAVRLGAGGFQLPVQATRDGQMVVFHDAGLDCRTDGHGPVRDQDLAALRKLDIGHGYTADGGRTFPLRGRGIGAMPTVEDALAALRTSKLVFTFKSRDPGDADRLAAALRKAGADPADSRFGYMGVAPVTARMRALAPGAWAFDAAGAKSCLVAYLQIGWSGFVPAACHDTTVIVPLNYQWAIWGWPNRFLARMAKANSKIVLMGDYKDGHIAGLETPAQLGDVPRSYRGYLWVENMYDVGRALQR